MPTRAMPVRRAALSGLLAVGLMATGAASTLAAGPQGPNTTTGTADCGAAGTFSFRVSGTSQHAMATTWSPAFLTSSTGQHALFIPSVLRFTFTTPQGTFSSTETKGHAPGGTTCSIMAGGGGFMLTGTVTGKIVMR